MMSLINILLAAVVIFAALNYVGFEYNRWRKGEIKGEPCAQAVGSVLAGAILTVYFIFNAVYYWTR